MHLKYTFDFMELNEWIIAIPVGDNANEFHGVIKLNETSAFIFKLLSKDITEEKIVDTLENEYDAPRTLIIEDVRKYIAEFEERGLLVR